MPKAESNLDYSSFFYKKLFFCSCLIFIFGLFFSRAILSISCVLLLVSTSLECYLKPKKITFNPIFFIFPLLYFALILSGFYSDNINYWKILLFKNSIFIVIPLAFLLSKKLSIKQLNTLLLSFILWCVACLTINSILVVLNYHQFLNDVTNSKNIQSVIGPYHSDLGVLSVISFVLLIYLISIEKIRKRKMALFLLLGLLFLELHFIAYRFSIVAIYLLCVIYCLKEIIVHKQFKYLIGIGTLILITSISILVIPAVKNRYNNTINDVRSIIENKNPNFQSIAQRWAAIQCASEIITKHPIFGVSPADASLEMKQQYDKNSYLLIPENRVFIHNQFLFLLLSFGIPFTFIFIILLMFLIYKGGQNQHLFIWLIIPFFFHMMIENTLEKQITASAFIFLLLLLAHQNDNKNLML